MIRLGVIGTNWISSDFVQMCGLLPDVKVSAVYSRAQETGESFALKHHIPKVFTDYDALLQGDHIDAIYIASPNALHFHQALLALEANKHVLCEKAITSNSKELKKLIDVAKERQLILMEAIKCLAMPTYHVIREHLGEIGPVRKALFNFCQRSSRYDALLKGELPNIFNPIFSAGALMDIGIYCIYPCVDLFGMPKTIKSEVCKVHSDVDGCGSILMQYEKFQADIMYSKINDSMLPSEIMGEEGSIIIDHISEPSSIKLCKKGMEPIEIAPKLQHKGMYYEVECFIEAIKNQRREPQYYHLTTTQSVMHLLDKVRRVNEIVFPAD